ncbi:MAG: hypothetical protein ABSG41_29835 [Bryobacteraceae bacterium]|jgi:hypothetical protein
MTAPLLYQSGDEIRSGDHVLLHGELGVVEILSDGIMVVEPKVFGYLFLLETEIPDYEDIEFVSRSTGDEENSD